MKSTRDQIEDIKRDGYSIDFAVIFGYAFENYKKIALYSALVIAVFTFIVFCAVMGLATAFYGLQAILSDFTNVLDFQKLNYGQQILSTIFVSVFAALFSPLGAGFLEIADRADKGEKFDFGSVFAYYKQPYFLQLFSAALILALVSNGISTIIDNLGIAYVGIGVSIVISYFTFFTIPLIIFGNLPAIEAIKSSLIVVSKSPFTIFALFVVGFLCSLTGVIGCCIGIIFTIVFNTSITYSTYYAIFEEQQQPDSIDFIGKSDFE
ncbi:hypothetical protein [Flavobacterium sp.]|uniref:hypothetical protein n=1 Tax=Flavobacterium sp. TaxID=239 RepID=UPI0031E114C5